MAKGLSAKVHISQEVSNFADTVNANLRTKVLVAGLDKAAEYVKSMYPEEVDDSRKTGTKDKQSDRAKVRWPTHIADKIIVKKLAPRVNSVLRLVGVRQRAAGQVNIHYGNKTMTVGRVHKLWWRPGVHEVYAKVNPRITRKDPAKIIARRSAPTIERMVVDEIKRQKLI